VHKIASRAKSKGIARLEFRETRTRLEAKAFERKKPQELAGRASALPSFCANQKFRDRSPRRKNVGCFTGGDPYLRGIPGEI
jgi:hypothetical protein